MYIFNRTNKRITEIIYDATYEFMCDVYDGSEYLTYEYTEELEGDIPLDFLHLTEAYISGYDLTLCMEHLNVAVQQFLNCIDLVDARIARELGCPVKHRPYSLGLEDE